MPSNAYGEKVRRAINQLENIERLLSQAPKKIYKERKESLESARERTERLKRDIYRELANLH